MVPKLAFSQVSKSVDLAFKDMGVLREPMDKRMEVLLKPSLEMVMANLKLAIATIVMAHNLEVWLDQLQAHLERRTSWKEILD